MEREPMDLVVVTTPANLYREQVMQIHCELKNQLGPGVRLLVVPREFEVQLMRSELPAAEVSEHARVSLDAELVRDEARGPVCEGPVGVHIISEAGPRWLCGLSRSFAEPGSRRCDSALLRACGSEAPQCPRRASVEGAS